MTIVFDFLKTFKEEITFVLFFTTGGIAAGLLFIYLSIPHIDTVLSQDIPSDMICYENWVGRIGCVRKEDLMFAHRYN